MPIGDVSNQGPWIVVFDALPAIKWNISLGCGVEVETTAVEIDCCFEVVPIPKPVGALLHFLNLAGVLPKR